MRIQILILGFKGLRASSDEPGRPGWPGYRDEFHLWFLKRKGQRSWGRVLVPNSRNKANMAKHKNLNFCAYHSFGNSSSCITAVKWDAYDVENTAGNARRCHPDHLNSSCFHPGNLSEVFIWQNFQPAYRDLENRASLPSHINASNILQRI